MDRITQLQDEIQKVCGLDYPRYNHNASNTAHPQLLMIMANSIKYLTTRVDFRQVSPQVPITKQRKPDQFDPPDVFEGISCLLSHSTNSNHSGLSVDA